MLFLSGLLLFSLLFWVLGWATGAAALQGWPAIGTYAAGIMFILVGTFHFTKKEKLESMIPPPLQRHARLLNFGSGALEIILGLLLFFPAVRVPAAWALIVLLILVFPANLHMARIQPTRYHRSRLLFQPVYIAWIWYFSI